MNNFTIYTIEAVAIGLPITLTLWQIFKANREQSRLAKAEAAAEARREAMLTAAIENAMINAARRRQAELQAQANKAARRKASEDFIEAYYTKR